MKAAWCTPFTPNSAIGQFSALVVQALRDNHGWDVGIFFPPGAGGRQVPDRGTELGKDAASQLGGVDVVFYNIGDHDAYHGRMIDLAPMVTGICILHDRAPVHLAIDRVMRLRPDERADELRSSYGSDAEEIVELTETRGADWSRDLDLLERFSMVEYVTKDMTAVVTHSRSAADLVRDRFLGDVRNIRLPYLHADQETTAVDLEYLDDRPVILQAGVLNTNKHIDVVVDAFALAGVRDRAQLVICGFGSAATVTSLEAQVRRLGLVGSVHIRGDVADEELHALRHRAIAGTVLRDPVLEAASASLVDGLAYGLALITSDQGHYGELPDGLTVRIAPPFRAREVAAVLRRWVDVPAEAEALGAAARDFALRHHTPAAYAEELVRLVGSVGGRSRREQIAQTMATNLAVAGFTPESPVVARFGELASELFGHRPRKADEHIFGPLGLRGSR